MILCSGAVCLKGLSARNFFPGKGQYFEHASGGSRGNGMVLNVGTTELSMPKTRFTIVMVTGTDNRRVQSSSSDSDPQRTLGSNPSSDG